MTQAELVTELGQRLGDSAHAIWSEAELKRYIQQGYDALTLATSCLYSQAVLPDFAAAFTYTAAFEAVYFTTGQYVMGPARFTAVFERDFVDNAPGPANHSYPWEYYGWTINT